MKILKRFNLDLPKVPKLRKIYKLLILALGLLLLGILVWNSKNENNKIVFTSLLKPQSSLDLDHGRLNVLLLGIAGRKHEGVNLTDTIMIASLDTKTSNVQLISLPRDIWSDKHSNKINALYQIGLDRGDGLGLTRQEFGEMLGINIPYAVRLDFNGFVEAINLVGGVDIDVKNSFDDYIYPVSGKEDDLCDKKETEQDISEDQAKSLGVKPGKLKVLLDSEGKIATLSAEPQKDIVYTDDSVFRYFPCRYEHLSFRAGLTPMDGETALKFVRSRHGTNGEGSDFARSKRQQVVLRSFKDKALSLDTLTDPAMVVSLIKTLDTSVETNLDIKQYPEILNLIRKVKRVNNITIDTSGPDPLLIIPPTSAYGAFVEIPPGNDYTRIRKYIDDIFLSEATLSGETK